MRWAVVLLALLLSGCVSARPSVYLTPWNDVKMDQAQYMPGAQITLKWKLKSP